MAVLILFVFVVVFDEFLLLKALCLVCCVFQAAAKLYVSTEMVIGALSTKNYAFCRAGMQLLCKSFKAYTAEDHVIITRPRHLVKYAPLFSADELKLVYMRVQQLMCSVNMLFSMFFLF